MGCIVSYYCCERRTLWVASCRTTVERGGRYGLHRVVLLLREEDVMGCIVSYYC